VTAARRPVVAGNIKMHLDRASLGALLRGVKADIALTPGYVQVVLCPAFPHLPLAQEILSGSTVALGAQNMHWDREGARTGEVAPGMLLETGCRHVILGHSERRTLFGETDEQVGKKVRAALGAGLVPILCVGETEEERRAGATEVVLSRQMVGALGGLETVASERLLVAYEPVWAIGTGRTATPETAQEAHRYLRSELGRLLGPETAGGVRLLYGGSVKPDNVDELMRETDIDGVLVGGAALQAASFLRIVNYRA